MTNELWTLAEGVEAAVREVGAGLAARRSADPVPARTAEEAAPASPNWTARPPPYCGSG